MWIPKYDPRLENLLKCALLLQKRTRRLPQTGSKVGRLKPTFSGHRRQTVKPHCMKSVLLLSLLAIIAYIQQRTNAALYLLTTDAIIHTKLPTDLPSNAIITFITPTQPANVDLKAQSRPSSSKRPRSTPSSCYRSSGSPPGWASRSGSAPRGTAPRDPRRRATRCGNASTTRRGCWS